MKIVALVVVLGFALGVEPARAQQRVSTLERVENLASAGSVSEARKLLESWWDSAGSKASREDRQRALWLRGRLTPDPSRAALDFRRLVVEYPGGPFTDQALFRLAQDAFASGDSAAARQRVTDLQRDYPGSPVRRQAENWLDAAGPPPPPAPPDSVRAAAESHAAATTAAPQETGASRSARSGSRATTGSRGPYAVQLGAFAEAARAQVLAAQARKAGLDDVRVVRVPGSRLVRVRTGRFDSSESAHNLLARVTRLGFQGAVVRDARDEEPVR